MRFIVPLVLALAACKAPEDQPLRGCDEIDPLAPGTPIDTFMALNTDRKCDFGGSCQFGESPLVCGEPRDDVKQVECKCMEGLIKCFDQAPRVQQLNEACTG